VLTKVKDEPDSDKRVLFPARFSITRLKDIQSKTLPLVFAQNYESRCRDDDASPCKEEYIEKCKALAHKLKLFRPCVGKVVGSSGGIDEYRFGEGLCFTGVDLAVKKGQGHDYVAITTIELRDFPALHLNGVRVVLDIEFGQWAGPEIVRKLINRYDRYGGYIVCEDNGAQAYIRQFAREERTDMIVRPFTTTALKHSMEYGVPSIFLEMSQGAWAIPNDQQGRVRPGIEKFIEECLHYDPNRHTGDVLMSAYFAREQAKKFQAALSQGKGASKGSLGMNIMAR
jgi:hypothetical protein